MYLQTIRPSFAFSRNNSKIIDSKITQIAATAYSLNSNLDKKKYFKVYDLEITLIFIKRSFFLD